MPRVEISSLIAAEDADAVFARLGDFASYPALAADVEEVTVTEVDAHTATSDWTVHFRSGLLCWTERDRRDPVARTIDFEQVDGDFEAFHGTWSVSQLGADVQVRFVSEFDLGMPSLASIIDPIAERALVEIITSVLRGLFATAAVEAG